jgi:hypothetical protein
MTQAEVSKLVALLMACYPHARFEPGTAAAYEGFLLELDHAQAKQAIGAAVRSCKFLPTIAEIMSAYHAAAPRPDDGGYPLFKPAPRHSGEMAPSELHAAITEFLEKGKAS